MTEWDSKFMKMMGMQSRSGPDITPPACMCMNGRDGLRRVRNGSLGVVSFVLSRIYFDHPGFDRSVWCFGVSAMGYTCVISCGPMFLFR